MRRFPVILLTVVSSLLIGSGPAQAQVNPIGPFSGSVFEGFNVALPLPSYQQYSIFGGQGLVKNIHPQGALKYEFSSERGGDIVLPRSPPTFGGQIGISEWSFTAPLARFGGYWENNSRFDDGVATFYDVNNTLIATLPMTIPKAAQAWTWNGWEFLTPVSKFVVTGNDTVFFGGFIWYEDATATFAVPVPETSSIILLSLGVLGIAGLIGYRYWRRHRPEPELEPELLAE